MKGTRWRRAGLAALLSALALASGCSSPTSSDDDDDGASSGLAKVVERTQGLSAAERERVLTEMAREEGRLELYTSLDDDVVGEIADLFERRYDVPVSLLRASSEDIATRVLEEARADRTRGDIAEASGLVMELLSDENRLEPWEPVGAHRLPDDALFEDWTAARTNRYVLAWNTERVSDGEQPRSWDDLADGRWRGKLVMEVSDSDFARTLIDHWVREGSTFEEAEERFAAIARNARFVDGHTLQAELLASGEFDAAAAAYAYQIDEGAEEGVPVAWRPAVSPTVTRPNGPGVVKGAPHPAAAALFIDWYTGAGQNDLRRLGLEPARSELADVSGVESAAIDLDAFLAEQEEWQERYDRFIALGGEGPSE
jgi:iron(III) transport system substrate-binding protein